MSSFSDPTKAALERQKQQEQQRETERAVVKDLAKVLGADGLEASDHTVKAVRKLLSDAKAQQARLAAAKASAANMPGRKAFAHLTSGPANRF